MGPTKAELIRRALRRFGANSGGRFFENHSVSPSYTSWIRRVVRSQREYSFQVTLHLPPKRPLLPIAPHRPQENDRADPDHHQKHRTHAIFFRTGCRLLPLRPARDTDNSCSVSRRIMVHASMSNLQIGFTRRRCSRRTSTSFSSGSSPVVHAESTRIAERH